MPIDEIFADDNPVELKREAYIRQLEEENRLLREELDHVGLRLLKDSLLNQGDSADSLVAALKEKEAQLNGNASNPGQIMREITKLHARLTSAKTTQVVEKTQALGSKLQKSLVCLAKEWMQSDEKSWARKQSSVASQWSGTPDRSPRVSSPTGNVDNREVTFLRRQLDRCLAEKQELETRVKTLTNEIYLFNWERDIEARERTAKRIMAIVEVQEENVRNETVRISKLEREAQQEKHEALEMKAKALQQLSHARKKEKELNRRERALNSLTEKMNEADVYFGFKPDDSAYENIENEKLKVYETVALLQKENERLHRHQLQLDKERARVQEKERRFKQILPRLSSLLASFTQ